MTRPGRHIPRLCRSCGAPMAGQQDSCWSCGAAWVESAERDDKPGNWSGMALLNQEDHAAITAAEPSEDDVALTRTA